MSPRKSVVMLFVSVTAQAALALSPVAQGVGVSRSDRVDPYWDTTLPRGQTRTIEFQTDEGTGMSVDLSPDQGWIVFDLLGNIYRVRVSGGAAENLTADSGIALNFHPVYSPDGRTIAFVSDRSGQNNLWLMDADGRNVRPVFLDPTTRISEPTWDPDGQSLIAVRSFATPGRSWHRVNTQIWQFPLSRSAPKALAAAEQWQYNSPSVAPDGKSIYFHASEFFPNRYGSQRNHHLQRLDVASGKISNAFPPGPTAEIMPLVSPNGQFLAFARASAASKLRYRGHEHEPGTALVVRDLSRGTEKVVLDPITQDLSGAHAMYSYRILPRFAWSSDSQSIVLTLSGKLARLRVADGKATAILFEATIHRVISEMTRGNIRIDDRDLHVKFIQWPTSSPDGSRIAFAAAGRLWIYDTKSDTCTPLMAASEGSIQLTPAWSPDGRRIAFATWNEAQRGQLWLINSDGTDAHPISQDRGEYAYPAWRSDSAELVVAVAPAGSNGNSTGWESKSRWEVRRVGATEESERTVTATATMRRPQYGPGGRIFFAQQDDPSAVAELTNPWPSDRALAQVTSLVGIEPDGTGQKVYARLPPATGDYGPDPRISPDGHWVAFQVDSEVYIAPLGDQSRGVATLPTDFNDPRFVGLRISTLGGNQFSWRDAGVLQFASGNTYVSYDTAIKTIQQRTINLTVPRAGGKGVLALTHARIITMADAGVIENGTLVIENARIRCVGRCDTSNANRIIDLSGKTVIPGLVDVHLHQTGRLGGVSGVVLPQRSPQLLTLAHGVTTIVDPSSESISAFPLAESIEAGVTLGPRTFSSAEIVMPSSAAFGERTFIRSRQDAFEAVNRRANWGAVTIKNFRNESRDQQQKLLSAALQRGITVTGEGGPLIFDLGVIMDGQTGWEHYIADLPVYRDFTEFAGRAGITYSPTVSVAGHGEGAVNYFRSRHDFTSDARTRRFSKDFSNSPPSIHPPPLAHFSFPIVAEGLADILHAGGHGAIGAHDEEEGIGSHWEIWAYASALTPLEALRVATIDGARFIGLEGEVGSLVPGKIADLDILAADPLKDIHNTTHIERVMKAGVLYDSSTLDEIWPKRKSPANLGRPEQ